ncbi:MAG TPA: hypothetical protein PLJ60_16965 [Chryseolinea sp.]|nr:hypothetical protein [Chryseolinea sp.]HPM32027.1 hypothetical protein [Chryseolinea sp.]
MKNTASKLTKTVGLLGLFLIGTILVNAQSDPSWTVSKGVQKVANKKSFEKEAKSGSQLQAASMSQLWAISKGVNHSNETEVNSKGNLPSTGVPSWTISKGVHRSNEAGTVIKKNVPTETPSLTTPQKESVTSTD